MKQEARADASRRGSAGGISGFRWGCRRGLWRGLAVCLARGSIGSPPSRAALPPTRRFASPRRSTRRRSFGSIFRPTTNLEFAGRRTRRDSRRHRTCEQDPEAACAMNRVSQGIGLSIRFSLDQRRASRVRGACARPISARAFVARPEGKTSSWAWLPAANSACFLIDHGIVGPLRPRRPRS